MTLPDFVIHADADLLVVDKPAGLVVHPAPSHRGETLVGLLGELAAGGEGSRPGIVHRLDKDTSGLMIVARNEASQRALAARIKRREVVREYLALVEGGLESRIGTIDAPLGRDRRRRTRQAVRGAGEREARTHFEVIEVLPADEVGTVVMTTGGDLFAGGAAVAAGARARNALMFHPGRIGGALPRIRS